MLTATARRRRWSNNERWWGPFTWSRDSYGKPLGIVLDSGHGEYPGCSLRLRGFGRTLIVDLPPFIRPWREKHIAESWDAATVERMGRNYYYEEHAREYGFQYSGEDGFLQVFFGPQTGDSSTTKSWCKFLPWKQWRFVRQSWYGPTGRHIETLWETSSQEVREAQWEWRREFEAGLAKVVFEIKDYDGKLIQAATQIEEREWRFGVGWFKWLSIFRKPKVVRSLDIRFSEEVGPEKGSWKGGLIGHGIDMLSGELHEAAFRRYCDQEQRSKGGPYRIAFVGRVE